MSTYIYNGGVVQPTYSADGKKITGLVNPDGTTASLGASTSVPIPVNNLIAFEGDSRTASSSFDTSRKDTSRLMQLGWVPWMLAACGYRVEAVDMYAVAGQRLDFNNSQLTGLPGSGGSVYKGNILSGGDGTANNPFPTQAGASIFIGSVNGVSFSQGGVAADSSTPWLGTNGCKQFIDNILAAHTASNKIVFLGDELPVNNDTGTGATFPVVQRERRDGLRQYSISATVVPIRTWNAVANKPDGDFGKTGFYLNTNTSTKVHMAIPGARALGEYIGNVINSYYSVYPVRNQIPTRVNQVGYMYSADMTGTGGTGTNITSGSVPTGFTATRNANAGLTCDLTQVVNAQGFTELVVHIYGTGVGAANSTNTFTLNRLLNNGSAASPINLNNQVLEDNDRIFTCARVRVDDGNIGLLGAGPAIQGQSSTVVYNSTADSAALPPSGVFDYSGDFGGLGLDYALLSQPITLPVGWSTGGATSRLFNGSVNIRYYADRAIDFTVRISQFGIVANR